MNLSEQIYRRAKAHNKGTALHIEMMKWAKEAQRLEQLQGCIKPLERPMTTDASGHLSQEERQGWRNWAQSLKESKSISKEKEP